MTRGPYLIIYYIAALTLIMGCIGSTKSAEHTPQPSDSLYTVDKAMYFWVSENNPQQALQLLDSAVIVGNTTSYVASLYSARIFSASNDIQNLDTARQICLKLLTADSVRLSATNRFNVLEQLATIDRLRGDKEQYLRWATQLATLCREQGWKTEELRTEAEIGSIMTHLGQNDEGLARLDDVISQLDGPRHFNELDATIIALKRKINVLSGLNRYSEVIPAAMRIIGRLEDYEQHPLDYADGSYREPDDDQCRTLYIDFYRSQALGFIANAYAMQDSTVQARHYVDLFEQTDYGKSFNGRELIAPAWCQLGDYGKMNAIYNEIIQRMGTDTLNERYAMTLRGRAIAAAAYGRHAESQNYWERYADMSQTLNDQLQASQAHNYAARYHAYEQQLEIQQQKAGLVRRNIYLAALFTGLLIAILFILYSHQQQRKVSEKNSALVRMIDNMQKARPKHDENDKNAELFRHIDQSIHAGHLYADQNLQRSDITERFGIRRELLNQLLNDYADGLNFPSYINSIRIAEACRILHEEPEKTVTAIADEVGLTLRNFQKIFRHQYGMTPTEYRNSKR